MEDTLQLKSEELFELIAELTIRYWRLSKVYFLLKGQVEELLKEKSEEINTYQNKIVTLERERNDLVLRYNQLESEVISLRSEVSRLSSLLSEKERENDHLRKSIEELQARETLMRDKLKRKK